MFIVLSLLPILLNVNTMACEKSEYFAPSLFLNHGGGPYPVLGEKHNIEIAESLKNVSQIVDLTRLKAIIIVTAHREEDIVTISSKESHSLLYDYYNFPPESYTLKYNAPGSSDLAHKIHETLQREGISSQLDDKRGWDHGVFIPMMLINPRADIPIVQVSILKNQNANDHYVIGKILYNFRKDGVAIFGSGMSYHNMKEFSRVDRENLSDIKAIANENFDQFLTEACAGNLEKRRSILNWREAPGGLESHPSGEADHLMPLIVNAGAGGKHPGKRVFESIFLNHFKLSGFIWDGGE